jgi:hypothetical protein
MFVGNIKIQFMKSFKLLIAVALITSFTSCSVQKRLYRKGYSVHWNSMDKSIKSDVVENKIESSDEEVKVENSDFASVSPEIVIKERPVVQLNDEKSIENKIVNVKRVDPPKCDLLLLKNGEEISAKVLEITPTEVKYKRCDNLEGPTTTINKSSIFSITYANGSKEIMKTENDSKPNSNENSSGDKKVGLAVASLVLGIIGFVFGGGLLGLIFGAVQLSKIRKQPNVYGGKGMATAGLILGIISVAYLLMLILIFI